MDWIGVVRSAAVVKGMEHGAVRYILEQKGCQRGTECYRGWHGIYEKKLHCKGAGRHVGRSADVREARKEKVYILQL